MNILVEKKWLRLLGLCVGLGLASGNVAAASRGVMKVSAVEESLAGVENRCGFSLIAIAEPYARMYSEERYSEAYEALSDSSMKPIVDDIIGSKKMPAFAELKVSVDRSSAMPLGERIQHLVAGSIRLYAMAIALGAVAHDDQNACPLIHVRETLGMSIDEATEAVALVVCSHMPYVVIRSINDYHHELMRLISDNKDLFWKEFGSLKTEMLQKSLMMSADDAAVFNNPALQLPVYNLLVSNQLHRVEKYVRAYVDFGADYANTLVEENSAMG